MKERWFKILEKTTQTGCWEYDLIEDKLHWSEQTYHIHGMDPSTELNVDQAISLYVYDDRETISEAFKRCLEKGENFTLRLKVQNINGKKITVESLGKPLFDEENKIIGAYGTFRDLTEEEVIIKQKRISENQLYQFKKNLYDFSIIAETDTAGNITSVNEKFCEISGFSREELIGQNHRIINSGMHPPEFFKDLWKTISSGMAWAGLICNKAKCGKYYWVESFIYPNLNIEREIIGYTAIRFDVTEKINMEHMLSAEREKATFMSQLASIGEISANIAHEIKNPLAVIQANMGILPRVLHDEEKLKKIQVLIERSTGRINKIVQGLQRLSYKSKEDEFTHFNFKELFLDTIDFCNEALRFHSIVINYDENIEDIIFFGNEIKLSQILLNLINNAKDAIVDADCDERWINIDIQNLETKLKISIIDSGPGVHEENKAKIMESFFTTKEKGKGTGLGLALVNNFVEEHFGDFYLDTEAKNTTFIIVFPKRMTEQKSASNQ